MEIKRIYLSGAMQFSSEEDLGWRDKFTEYLPSIKFDDPTSKSFQLPGEPSLQEIVRHDLTEMLKSDAVVVYWTEGCLKGAGTKGEMTVAAWHRMPVYLITENEIKVPQWCLGCTTRLFNCTESCIEYLKGAECIEFIED